MNDVSKKLADEMNLFPTIPVSEDEKQTLESDAWYMSKDGAVRNDYSVSDDEVILIAELQKCKNIRTIKNILIFVATLFALNAISVIYFVIRLIG